MHQNGQCIFVEYKCACEGCDKEKTGNEAPDGASVGVFGKLELMLIDFRQHRTLASPEGEGDRFSGGGGVPPGVGHSPSQQS